MNDYYNNSSALQDFTRARTGPLNNNYEAIAAGFDLLPSLDAMKQIVQPAVVTAGTVNALVIANAYPIEAYVLGQKISFKAAFTNSSAVTVNIDGLGAKALVRADGTSLIAADLMAGRVYEASYDGTSFQLSTGIVDLSETGVGSYIALVEAHSLSASNDADIATQAADESEASAIDAAASEASAIVAKNAAEAALAAFNDAMAAHVAAEDPHTQYMLESRLAHVIQSSDRALTSTTSAQRIFGESATGAVALAVGRYTFEMLVYVSDMASASDNAAIGLVGAGTATMTNVLMMSSGIDGGSLSAAGPVALTGRLDDTALFGTRVAEAAVGSELAVMIRGTFRITVAGTIIPSISLETAAAATVETGSYFRCEFVGTSATSGTWS